MKAIIIAAGRGSRLEGHTHDCPKCMVDVGGMRILDTQLDAMRHHGVEDIHIIRGYLADRLVVDGATYHENRDWEQNNILFSLFTAESALHGPLLTTYSDIVYTRDVMGKLLRAEGDIRLIIDRRWADAYVDRQDHPIEQAELAVVEEGKVTSVGKWVGPERAAGEFIGLAACTATGSRQLCEVFADVRKTVDDDQPFQHAQLFRKAYLCDLFEEMIARGYTLTPVFIDGGWREIDTVEDLQRVSREWTQYTEKVRE